MINDINNWIISILSLGIIITFIELILPKGKNRKYIYVLIGLLTIITIINPVIKYVTDVDFDKDINKAFEEFTITTSSNYDKVNLVKDEFKNNLENDIKSKFLKSNIIIKDVFINCSDEYVIEKISIYVTKEESKMVDINEVIDQIIEEYKIEYSRIEVVREED